MVLKSTQCQNGSVEKKQRGLNTHRRSPLPKGPTMVALLVLLTATAVTAIAGALALTVTDGYGRVPEQTYSRAL
jgi:hypothetical protein